MSGTLLATALGPRALARKGAGVGLIVCLLLPCQVTVPGPRIVSVAITAALLGFAGWYLARRFGLARPAVVGWGGAVAAAAVGYLSLVGMDAVSILVGRYPPEFVPFLLRLAALAACSVVAFAGVAVLAAPGLAPARRVPGPVLLPLGLVVTTALLAAVPYSALLATADKGAASQFTKLGVPLLVPQIDGFLLSYAYADDMTPDDKTLELSFRGHLLGPHAGKEINGDVQPADGADDCTELPWGQDHDSSCREAGPNRWLLHDGEFTIAVARHGQFLVQLETTDDIPERVLLDGVARVQRAGPEELVQ